MSEWQFWSPGLTTPPKFRFFERLEIETVDGRTLNGRPEEFHWYPESAREDAGAVVRRWRSASPTPLDTPPSQVSDQ